MSNTILAIIEMDRFPQEVANRAAWIAEHYGCDLQLLLSDPTLGFLRDSFMISADSQHINETIRQAQEEELEALAESIKAKGIEVTSSIVTDRPASDAIVAKAIECEPMFVFKGTLYHSPAERATFRFTDWQLIRKLGYPLWLVKQQDWREMPVIVAAVDPLHRHDKDGTLDQAIVETGKDLATKCNGKLHLLHTYEQLDAIGRYTKLKFSPKKVPVDEIAEQVRADHRRHLDSLAAKNEIDPDAIHMLPGRTQEILPAFAREHGAELVIMGALARTGLKRRFIGSTAEQTLDHLHCDILIARAP